ncbi:nesprin-1 [Trichonephila inaurata madagascariensis]|uniref:Nesprin-1 n=1 Tax=Trichonephila inaurata madagascariensis TaxID=2747483 RepID=A0A8X6WS53_9ARAC|nr:nesprin-1 [Trichonephila inaurata madagascariensis]
MSKICNVEISVSHNYPYKSMIRVKDLQRFVVLFAGSMDIDGEEQERVQKKVFTNWTNHYLAQHEPPMRVEDLIDDLRDGSKLIALIEHLSGERLHGERGRRLRRPHFLSNVNQVLQFLERKRIKLVNINATDIVDGKPTITLGLIWTIILHFQIEEKTKLLTEQMAYLQTCASSTSSIDSIGRHKVPCFPMRFGVTVSDFGSSWRDGWAFLAIIHRIRPGLVSLEKYKNMSNIERLDAAFTLAEKELGIARLLDPEDVDVPHPDEKSIMTYVAQFLHLYPETYASADLDEADVPITPTSDVELLSLWLDKAESVLATRRNPSIDYKTQYFDFYTLKSEMKTYRDIYERLRSKINSNTQDIDLKAAWPNLVQRWAKIAKELQDWQHYLDNCLPGQLGQLSKWIIEAERRLGLPILPHVQTTDMLPVIQHELDDHQTFFKPLESHLKFFQGYRRLPDSFNILPEHVEDLQSRLDSIAVRSHQRQVKLVLELSRYTLLNLLSKVEEQLKQWNTKYGYEKEVSALLQEYKHFVDQQKIYQEYDKLYAHTKSNIETCQHVGALDAKEMDKVEKFLSDVDGLWKKMMVELHSVGNTANQVLKYWKLYSGNVSNLLTWLDKAEMVIKKDTETQLEFFSDLTQWVERKNQVIESGEYLAATCREDISSEIKQTISNIQRRWEKLHPLLQEFLVSGEILRERHMFQKNLKQLQLWLQDAENILSTVVPCRPADLEHFTEQLKKLQTEWEEYDNLFKKLSKQMHSVVTHLNASEVEKVMSTMKKEKEKMLHIKTNLMSEIPLLYELVALQSTFEKGYSDIAAWLQAAEDLIASYGIPSSAEAIAVVQDKHKAFFSAAPTYKSKLESQKNVYKNIVEHASGVPNIDIHEMQMKMSILTTRLESGISLADKWENAMADAANRWSRYNKSTKIVKEKLQAAEALLEKKPSDEKQLQSHKEFFSQLNDSIIKDLLISSEEVLATLPAAEQGPVRENVSNLQERWKLMMERIPFHLREFFTVTRIAHVKDCLDFLKSLSDEYKISPSKDINLRDSYQKHQKEWSEVEQQIELILSQLQKLKADWTEYCQRFNDLLKWMDEVEKNIRSITQDISSADEFETVKTKFLSVCQTVDSKREDVKWLVRKLDNLLTHIPKEEGVEEQKKLDTLLLRYKTLLPEIDTTIMVTETITKCFIYRKEITEVNRWLKEVRALTDQIEETSYDDPETLFQLVQQQEAIVHQLETNLGNVKSSVQKGKELGKLQRSPKFVEKDVSELEKNWEEVYQKATHKLTTLKSARSLWNDYDKQKDEIFRLLKQADEELKKLKASASLQQPPKQYKELHQTTETHLEKLKSVGSNLAPKLSERQRPLLQKEVVEIENKVLMVLSTLKENVEYLERSTEKWTKFNFKLEGFVADVDGVIDKLKEILSESSSPEVRLKKLDELHCEIREQKQVLVNLETESKELAVDQPDSSNVKQIIGQLTNLKDRLHTLEETVITQRNIIAKNLDGIKNVKDILKSERDELKAAELRVEAGLPALTSLKDAHEKKKENETFCEHCHQKINYLSDVGTQTAKELSDASIQCEFIQLQDQWKDIAQTIQEWIEKLQSVIVLWEGISIKQEDVIKWLEITEEKVENITSTQTVNIQKLEELKSKLRALSSEVDEKRNYVRTITKDIEDLSGHLSPKAVMALHVQTSDIQKRIDELGDRIRRHQIHLGSSIAEQEQLLKTIDTFTHWEEDVKLQLHKFDDIFVDQIEAVLKNIELLKIENDSRQTDFNGIYEEVKKLSDSHDSTEIEEITTLYSKLSELYQNTEELLSKKQKLLQKRLDFEAWYKDMYENIVLLKNKIEGKKYSADELQNAADELSRLQREYEKKVTEVSTLDELFQKVNQIIRDRNTTLPVTVADRLNDIQRLLKVVKDLLTLEQEGINKLSKKWDEFNKKYEALCQWLSSVNKRIDDMQFQSSTFADFEQQLKVLKELHKEMEDQTSAYSVVHQLGRSLIEEDSSSFSTIQGYLTATDKQWEQLSSDLSQKEKSVAHLLQLWKECNSLQGKLQSAMNNASQAVKAPNHVSCDSVQVSKLLEKAKAGSEILKTHHYELDAYMQKSKDLCDKLTSYNVQDASKLEENYSNIKKRWQDTWKEVESRLQNLESQMVVWQQIDCEKEEIIAWATEICRCLNEEINNFESREKADLILDRYKSELTTHLEMKKGLFTKIESLRNLNDNAEIPTLTSLKTVIENHFEEAEDLAKRLQSCISELGIEEDDIKKELQELNDWLRLMRENISKCEDVSADDEAILQNHEICKQLEAEILAHKNKFDQLDAKIGQSKQKHSKLDTSYIEKESNNLQKRYEKVKNTASKIANFLSSSVERRYQLALQDYQRWMLTNTEKLSSCKPDLVGDRYSLEAKLGLLQEIESNLVQGENKKTKLEVTAANIIQVLPAERHSEIQSVINQSNNEWESFVSSISTIKASLLKNLSAWQKYETEYENFSSWLRDMESKVKSVTTQQVELNDIQQQLQVVKNLQSEVSLKKKNLDDLLQIMHEICTENPEARLKTQTTQVTSRYQALERTLQEALRRLEGLLKVKKEYETSKVTLQNWLKEMDKQLESNYDVSGDKETLQSKLQSLKIRKEMRHLRDSWDEKWEKVSTTIKNIESALMAWGTFEESCKQVGIWLNELSGQMGSEVHLKPTLAEKKLQLQSFKALAQGILGYQTVITKLKDKASTLPESAPKHNVESFQAQYDSLISAAKDRVQTCDQHVVEHEVYSVKLEHFQDWLSSLKAAVDTNIDQGDTESLKMKIIALSTVLSTLEEGKNKLADLEKMLEEVLQHTDARGHGILKSELNDVREQWKNFMNQCQHAHDTLSGAVEDRGSCEAEVSSLEEWLSIKEHLLREQALRSNLETKQAQLQNVKSLENEILSKQTDITPLTAKIEQLRGDTTLTSRMSRILNKYQSLKNAAKILSDQLSQNLYHIETTIELGEKLYSSTSPEGREIIRQKIRNLQKHWEVLQEKCNGSLRAVDSCLQKLISFSQGQDRLSKWLQEVGLSVQQHTEPKSTIQEKRAQLQSQKVIHQDILSHKPLLESVM